MTPAGALPLGPGALRPAVEAAKPVEQTACWRAGWRGWGWYRCWGGAYYGGPYYYHHWRHPYEDDEDDEHEWHHRHWWR
jgi:hypothetical protein